jgi:orotidine-5'-phosphate decarboxylase
LTLNPYLGDDAMAPFLAAAKRTGKGLFVLVKTSNPGSRLVMDSGGGEGTVSERLADFVEAQGVDCRGTSGYSLFGAVVGGTFPEEVLRLRHRMPHTILLVPGVGTQGAAPASVRAAFDGRGRGAIVPMSRALTYPAPAEMAGAGFRGAVRARIERAIAALISLG